MASEYTIEVKINDTKFQEQLKRLKEAGVMLSMGPVRGGGGGGSAGGGGAKPADVSGPMKDAVASLQASTQAMKEAASKMKAASRSGGGGKGGGGLSGLSKISGRLSKIGKNTGALIGIGASVGGIFSLITQSSPMLQNMFKMVNYGVMMLLRPIGDFIGMLMKPLAIEFIRVVAPLSSQMRKDMMPVVKKWGEFLADFPKNLGDMITAVHDFFAGFPGTLIQAIKDAMNPFYKPEEGAVHVRPPSEEISDILNKLADERPDLIKDGKLVLDPELDMEKLAEELDVDVPKLKVAIEYVHEYQGSMDARKEAGDPLVSTPFIPDYQNDGYRFNPAIDMIPDEGYTVIPFQGSRPGQPGDAQAGTTVGVSDEEKAESAATGGLLKFAQDAFSGFVQSNPIVAAYQAIKNAMSMPMDHIPDEARIPGIQYAYPTSEMPEDTGAPKVMWHEEYEMARLLRKGADVPKMPKMPTRVPRPTPEPQYPPGFPMEEREPYTDESGHTFPTTKKTRKLIDEYKNPEVFFMMKGETADDFTKKGREAFMAKPGTERYDEYLKYKENPLTYYADPDRVGLGRKKTLGDDLGFKSAEGVEAGEGGGKFDTSEMEASWQTIISAFTDIAAKATDSQTSMTGVAESFTGIGEQMEVMSEEYTKMLETLKTTTESGSNMIRQWTSVGLLQIKAALKAALAAIAAASKKGKGGGGGGGSKQMAEGGIIDEHIIGVGQSTGQTYELGERGREYVIPESKMRTESPVTNIRRGDMNVAINIDKVVNENHIKDIQSAMVTILDEKKRAGVI